MINTSEIKLRIFRLEQLKKSAGINVKRITKHIEQGFQTKLTTHHWENLYKQYENEINNLKKQINGNTINQQAQSQRERHNGQGKEKN